MKNIFLLSIVFILLAATLPFTTLAQDVSATAGSTYAFQREGIFGCKAGQYSNVGTFSAIGGIYVPVNDAAVTLNTGYLVYKECVLRGIVDRMRESATSAYLKQMVQSIETGRDGNAQYVVNQGQEELAVTDQQRLQRLQDGTLSSVNTALQTEVKRFALRSYMAKTRKSNAALACNYQGNLNEVLGGRPTNVWAGLDAVRNPACDPLFASMLADEFLSSQEALALEHQRNQWNWGQGFYSKVVCDPQNPLACRIVTPAAVVQQSFQQVLGTGFRQLENANDIDQMVGALFAGIGNQVLGNSRGLSGITQSVGSQPSYLDRVAAESAAGLRNASANAALQILAAARQVENSYLQAVTNIATSLRQAITQLRSAENSCWALIIPKVCASTLSANNTCTSASGSNLKVATSTAYSQPVIESQVAPFATTTAANITKSATALRLLEQLIAGVTNTTSLNAQRLALEQLDQLIATRALHTQQDLSAVQQQATDVQAAMTKLVEDTVKAWGDSTDVNVGWCNVNNDAVIQYWDQKWRI